MNDFFFSIFLMSDSIRIGDNFLFPPAWKVTHCTADIVLPSLLDITRKLGTNRSLVQATTNASKPAKTLQNS